MFRKSLFIPWCLVLLGFGGICIWGFWLIDPNLAEAERWDLITWPLVSILIIGIGATWGGNIRESRRRREDQAEMRRAIAESEKNQERTPRYS
jgi:hypothetical protein